MVAAQEIQFHSVTAGCGVFSATVIPDLMLPFVKTIPMISTQWCTLVWEKESAVFGSVPGMSRSELRYWDRPFSTADSLMAGKA